MAVSAALSSSPNRFIGFTAIDVRDHLFSVEVDPKLSWNQVIPSWNAETPGATCLRVDITPIWSDKEGKTYDLGTWRSNHAEGIRQSTNDQLDGDAKVLTDTLVLTRPAERLRVRVTLQASGNETPSLKFFGLSFTNTDQAAPTLEPNKAAWGQLIDVPERAQGSYPNGSKICSPTTVSMIMSHWAAILGRPELDPDVPTVCDAIYDPNWPGTGNWPFNTAYAGSFPGMRAYVTRLTSVRQLEDWIVAGVPIATSVAYDILRYGERRRGSDGHLVVLVGFTKEGDPIFNDPGNSEQIRRVFKREMFEKAWAESHNTVYIIHPESRPVPKDLLGNWYGEGNLSVPN